MLVGRDAEIALVERAIERVTAQSARLLIAGEPGIGKTSLVAVALERADALGHRVLVARPTQAEAPLPFAVLADLLRDVDLALLEPARRRVLDVALGREDASGPPPPASHLGFALVDVIEHLVAAGRPVTVVVDDVQWSDVASRELLEFAVRRLPAAGVGVIVALRATPGVLEQVAAHPLVEGDQGRLLVLRPLDPEHTAAIARGAVASAISPSVLDRIVATSGGNPLYAIEFARATRAAAPTAARPLVVPESLAAATRARFEGVDGIGREALAAVAMLAHPTLDVLSDLGLLDALHASEEAQIVEVRGRRVHFTHPVLATAAYEAITGTRRLDLHRRLAAVTTGTERCLHLALGATHPDAALAAELTEAALADLARGAPTEAAEVGLLALEATPDDDPQRWRRVVTVSDLLFRAGRTEEAVAQVQLAHARAPEVDVRARALLTWATIEFSRSADSEIAAGLARACLDLATDPDLRAEAHSILARADYLDFVAAAEHAAAALDLLRDRSDVEPAVLAAALTASAAAGFNAGFGLDRASLEQAMVLQEGTSVLASDSAYGTLAALLKYADELDEAREMFESLARAADPASLPYALGHLPQLLVWTGEWDEAERCALRHLALAEETRQESQVETARFNLALIAAHRGDAVAAEPVAKQLWEVGRAEGTPWTERMGAALLGFLAMSRGDAEAAASHFRRYDELAEEMRLLEPGFYRFHGDYAEALVALGQADQAEEVLDRLGERVARLPRPSVAAAVQRGRALVAAVRGDRDGALAAARAAVAALDGTLLRYDHARSLLTLGIVARRFQERSLARDTLADALTAFERMGAASLAQRARRERNRVSGRAPATTSPHTSLTATETSVAELAAAGMTTRQIAEALYISAKTVEANLTRVYRKLGVANRAQLANHMAQRTADG